MGGILKLTATLFLFCLFTKSLRSQDFKPAAHDILVLNSYSITYTWTDSINAGLLSVFSQRDDVNVYIEFLDAKRFARSAFPDLYELFKKKYHNINFDVAIVCDNDALDFMVIYGDSLLPGIPVVFCGINNPEDYSFENSNFYGILDGIDLKAELDLISRVMPDLKNIYFISDSITTTSLINLSYIKKIEPEFADRFRFSYICNYSVDSLLHAVAGFEEGSAIALINYYQDRKGNPLNPESINLEVTKKSPVPVFMESETLLGKGIAGGIFIKGRTHGSDAAELALNFIDIPGYKPPLRVTRPINRYYFDYNILEKFNIANNRLPPGSVVINQPKPMVLKYLKYIVALLLVIGLLLVVVFVLLINIRRRRKAELLVKFKLDEIQEKNLMLEEAHEQVKDMNIELEEINEHLSLTNDELSRARIKSEESDRLKSAFLANMSHEIRTPLNAIVGFSSLLDDPQLTAEEKQNFFRIINTNSSQLLNIIEDILDLSRIEAGQLNMYIEVFSLHDLLAELVDSFSKSKTNHNVTIILLSGNKKAMLRTDPGRLRQILTNLISNALKFTKEGSIEIGYSLPSDKQISIYVKDTGIGIDKKDLQHVFSRFWKSNDGEFRSGTGLGLAICKSLCEAMGGSIRVESQAGKGTTFIVTLPDYFIKQDSTESEEVGISRNEYPDWSHITIAVAEDEYSNLLLLKQFLKPLKVNIVSFRNGREMVDFFHQNNNQKIDLIMMDLKMPLVDGYEATKLIREINGKIPIIAQTAYAMIEDIERIKAYPFDDYIVKPIRFELLVEKMQKILFPDKG